MPTTKSQLNQNTYISSNTAHEKKKKKKHYSNSSDEKSKRTDHRKTTRFQCLITTNRIRIVLVFLNAFVLSTTAQSITTTTISSENHPMSFLLVALIGAFFCLVFIAVCIRHCIDDPFLVDMAITDNNNTAVAQISGGDGLDKELIEKFPIVVYSEVKDLKIDKVQLECAVCLNEFEDYEQLRLLTNCDHVFHPQCIDVWLASHVTCPVCRTILTPQSDQLNGRVEIVVVEEQPSLTESNSRSIIREEQYQISANILNPNVENRFPRSTSYSDGKFPRSHTTGHSLVEINGNLEKYTLRLPDEVRKQIEVNSQTKSRGIAVCPQEESSKIGYGNGVDAVEGSSKRGFLSPKYERSDRRTKSDQWVFTKARPFLSRGGSIRSPKLGGNMEISV